MTDEEIDVHDKLMVARHEAGHAVIAASEGVYGSPWIFPNDDANEDEKKWCGKFQVVFGTQSPVCSVAGMVAEYLADDPEAEAQNIVWLWEAGDISPPSETDMTNVPDAWAERHELDWQHYFSSRHQLLNLVIHPHGKVNRAPLGEP